MKIVALIIGSLVAQVAWGCTCVESTDELEYGSASAVLLVRITSTRLVLATKTTEFDAVQARFEVIETYKGHQGKLQFLMAEKTSCELPLIAGELYLVYSRGAVYETLNTCTRSRWIDLTRDKALLDEYSGRQ